MQAHPQEPCKPEGEGQAFPRTKECCSIRFMFQKGHSGCLEKDSLEGPRMEGGGPTTIQKKGKGSLGNRGVN